MCVTAAFGAAIGGGFAYGWSVAANISNNGMSVDAFTSDVDWGSVGQGALVGGVVGLTGGLGTAYLGTSMGAGAVSGVMAGQAGVAASNLIGGETWNAGMGDPYQVAFDAVTGAAGSLVSGKLARSSSASKSPIPGKGYQNEVTSTNPVRPKDAIDKWTQFLGDEPYSNIHPRTGQPHSDLLVSKDGTRSI